MKSVKSNSAIWLPLTTIVIGGLVSMPATAQNRIRSEAEIRETLRELYVQRAVIRELSSYAASDAVMCGLVFKGRDRSDAIDCARTSIERHEQFVVAFQGQGKDSDVWAALVGDAKGALRLVRLNSALGGQKADSEGYRSVSLPCVGSEFAVTDNGDIQCRHDKEP